MFKIKKSYIILMMFVGVVLVIASLYGTFALNSVTELSGDNYVVTLTESSEVVNLKANSGKTVFYRVTNTNRGKVNYGIAYKGSNVTVRAYSDYYEDIDGILDYGQSKFIELYIENNSSSENSVTISTVLGYENGGDLIVPNGYKLVTLKYYPISKGKYFNGETDYVDMGCARENLGQSVTIGARFIKYNKGITYLVANVENGGLGLYSNNDNRIGIGIMTETMSTYKWINLSIADTNEYHTVVATYDGQTVKLYIDGEKVASEPVTGNIKVTPVPFYVGANPNGSNAQEYFEGYISDAFLTSEVLDENTIKNNFTNDFIYDENDSTYFYFHFD